MNKINQLVKTSLLAIMAVAFFINSHLTVHAEINLTPRNISQPVNASPGDVRFVSYKNGNAFAKKSGSKWVELGTGGVELNTFIEMEKTADTLRLFDHSRQVSILLHFGSLSIFSCPGGNSCSGEVNLLGLMEQYLGEDTSANKLIRNVQRPAVPDLNKPWTSDFGNIVWGQAYYDNPDKTLEADFWYYSDENEYVMQGGWGRKSNPEEKGMFVFKFSHDGKSFKGFYTNDNNPEQGQKPWTGKALQ